MKKKGLIICLLCILGACKKQPETYLIEATITGMKDSTTVILLNTNTFEILDSTRIINNKFAFKGSVTEPTEVGMSIYNIGFGFWLENKKFKINSSKKELLEDRNSFKNQITWSETNKIAFRYDSLLKPLNERSSKAYMKLRENLISEEEYQKHTDSIDQISLQFLLENPNNYFTLSRILAYKNVLKKEQLKEYFSLFSTELKSSSYGKLLDDYIHIKPVKEGDNFADIIGNNLKEEEVKLSDYKGKVILLDFWAGWCPPCIKQIKEEFPVIIEKYKNENFQIVSFSFDFDKKMWKDANAKLNIDWPDFSNLTMMQNSAVAMSYSISQIPTSFIIGADGKILKRVEYDDDLEKELDKVFAQKE